MEKVELYPKIVGAETPIFSFKKVLRMNVNKGRKKSLGWRTYGKNCDFFESSLLRIALKGSAGTKRIAFCVKAVAIAPD